MNFGAEIFRVIKSGEIWSILRDSYVFIVPEDIVDCFDTEATVINSGITQPIRTIQLRAGVVLYSPQSSEVRYTFVKGFKVGGCASSKLEQFRAYNSQHHSVWFLTWDTTKVDESWARLRRRILVENI